MSTRSVFEIKSPRGSMFIYKHWFGYPSGAQECIRTTIDSGLAWQLPRFEPDEFGAALIAANKTAPGNWRLLGSRADIPADVEYWHVLHVVERRLCLTSYHSSWSEAKSRMLPGRKPIAFATYGACEVPR